jgi:HD superfamily phosphodiesterase
VAGHARELLAYIDADPVLTLAVAYLHDIGIHEAERRHGSSAGNFQEIEGPPIARRLLEELSASVQFIDAVAGIVGRHHTRNGVDAPEFRILWDADALVNFDETLPGRKSAEIEQTLRCYMVTEAGYRAACRKYLSGGN